ncbi:unnamed protein product [Prorocentrum cordatum]|uniref:Fibronectin type-III domain-containing protein n=1 Tax=Prorocentrum cordatum TaxID=2364126 RepID=A0ABN9S7C9_9DINO|nr:unnamed protein product [Polarella glacialis]
MASPLDLGSDEVYTGHIKSYNDRRGFGFIACQETAKRFGRDVYIAKTEAQLAAAEAAGDEAAIAQILAAAQEKAEKKEEAAAAGASGENGGGSQPPGEKPPPPPRLAEEDLVHFQVRLSVEGFPQAHSVQKLQKFEGVVRTPVGEDGSAGRIASQGLPSYIGESEVDVRQDGCGQVRLVAGDQVTFCVKGLLEGKPAPAGDRAAAVVSLMATGRSSGSVLGYFRLELPRPPGPEGQAAREDLRLDCHAFGEKIILAGLPPDTQESELSRFFTKQGATSIIVAHAKGCSFASVSFPSILDVARLLARTAHAFADDKETRIATLLSYTDDDDALTSAQLPALPAPLLGAGEEPGSLLVVWSPLVLAVGYSVELRAADGVQPWATVDVAAGRIGSGSSRFDAECSSCKVTGLSESTLYEARVTYFTSVGSRSEASDPSEQCAPLAAGATPGPPAGAPPPLATPGVADPAAPPALSYQIGAPPCWPPPSMPGGAPMWPSWGTDMAPPDFQAAMAGAMAPPPMMPPPQSLADGSFGSTVPPPFSPSPGWRCIHGTVIPPPSAPELQADPSGFAITVQWPSVAHAISYVVELREAGSASAERFIRSAPMATLGSLVELRIGGLRPGGGPGRAYTACVRCVSMCNCESAPSDPGWSSPLGTAAAPQAPPCGAAPVPVSPPLSTGLPPPPQPPAQVPDAAQAWTPWMGVHPEAPPLSSLGASHWPGLGLARPCADPGMQLAAAGMPPPLPPLTAPPAAPPGPPAPPAHAPAAGPPAAPLAPGAPTSPPPSAPPTGLLGVGASLPKEAPPEAGRQEDCLILD